jgi:hypothetical protein
MTAKKSILLLKRLSWEAGDFLTLWIGESREEREN